MILYIIVKYYFSQIFFYYYDLIGVISWNVQIVYQNALINNQRVIDLYTSQT